MHWIGLEAFEARCAQMAREGCGEPTFVGKVRLPEPPSPALLGPAHIVEPWQIPCLDGLGFHRCWFAASAESVLCIAEFGSSPGLIVLFALHPPWQQHDEAWRVLEPYAHLVPGLLEHLFELIGPEHEGGYAVYTNRLVFDFEAIYRAPSREDAEGLARFLQAASPVTRWLVGRYPEEDEDRYGPGWGVFRQDDNGHTFLVERCASRLYAELRAAALEASGHKQMYWVERATRTS